MKTIFLAFVLAAAGWSQIGSQVVGGGSGGGGGWVTITFDATWPQNTTAYIWPNDKTSSTTEADRRIYPAVAGSVTAFAAEISTGPVGCALTFTLRKNGADTASTFTVADGSPAALYKDVAHSVQFTATDYLTVKVASGATCSQAAVIKTVTLSATGPKGDTGTPGSTVLSGTAAPTNEGSNGDWYLRTTTMMMYGPKADGVWPAGTSLVGPTGASGTDGASTIVADTGLVCVLNGTTYTCGPDTAVIPFYVTGTGTPSGTCATGSRMYINTTDHSKWYCSNTNTWARLVTWIASGTATLGTSSISANTCATVVTVSASGVATTDVITWTPNADLNATTGYGKASTDGLQIYPYPTADNVNFKICNGTASAITPGAATLNWMVAR